MSQDLIRNAKLFKIPLRMPDDFGSMMVSDATFFYKVKDFVRDKKSWIS
jgi:hypothetical protein